MVKWKYFKPILFLLFCFAFSFALFVVEGVAEETVNITTDDGQNAVTNNGSLVQNTNDADDGQ